MDVVQYGGSDGRFEWQSVCRRGVAARGHPVQWVTRKVEDQEALLLQQASVWLRVARLSCNDGDTSDPAVQQSVVLELTVSRTKNSRADRQEETPPAC